MTKRRFSFLVAAIVCLHSAGFAEVQKSEVNALIQDLRSQEPDKREHAAEVLSDMGPAAAGAAKALGIALSDDFPYVRKHSGEALSKIGPTAIPIFIEALKNPNDDVRTNAASALGHFGPEASAAIPGLVNALNDPNLSVRERAAHALEQMGPDAVPPLLHLIETTHDHSTPLALQALGSIQTTDATVVPRLLKVLENSDDQIRVATAKTLVRQGKSHLLDLLPGLKSENASVRVQVADILGDIGRRGAAAVPALINVLNDVDPAVRGAGARALGKMGSEGAKTAIPALKKLLQDPNETVVSRAREALTNLIAAIEPAERSEEDNRLLTSKDEVHDAALDLKPVIKKTPKPASKVVAKKLKRSLSAAELVQLLHSPDEAVRAGAIKALTQMKEKAFPALTAALQEGTTTIRQSVAQAFIQIDSTAAVRAFDETSKEGDLAVRLDALLALHTMGEGAKAATPTLITLLKDPSADIQSAADMDLQSIGTDEAKKALEAYHQQILQKTMSGLLKDLRQEGKSSAEASAKLFKLGPLAVKPVSQLLADTHVFARRAAAKLLNKFGTESAPATHSLIDALEDSDLDVRHQSAEALGKVNTAEAKSALRFFPIKDVYYRIRSYFKH